MTTYVDIVPALPATGNGDKSLTREALVKRYAYCLADSESLGTITVTDPDYGAIPLYVVRNRHLFQYDPTDSTTADDGLTCLVSADGKRYKIDDYLLPWSVKSKTLTAPPGSPAIGDAYIVAVASTGAWSGKDNQIATFTSRSWLFTTIPEGRHVFNEADGAFYYLNASGTWTQGAGALPFASAAVPLSAIVGVAASLTSRVVNQTTNTPPVSPSVGDSYIIGSSPTGSWSGNAAKVAICQIAGSFVIYTPQDGDVVYDIAQKLPFRWDSASSTWKSASGNMKAVTHVFTSSNTYMKDARSVMVQYRIWGGSGGAHITTGAGAGGTSSFGAHASATGSAAVNSGGGASGAPGTASGGDVNLSGLSGTLSTLIPGNAGVLFSIYGRGITDGTNVTGGGGYCEGWLLAASIGTSESVTVGAAGVSGGGTAGNQGLVIIEEWVLT